jgi:hypothetical protein
MAAQIELKRNFRGDCVLCRCAPRDEDNKILPMFVAIGVDVNWGEDANICTVCAGVMADILGRVESGRFEKLKSRVGILEDKLTEVTDEKLKQDKILERIRDGSKAQKEVRSN